MLGRAEISGAALGNVRHLRMQGEFFSIFYQSDSEDTAEHFRASAVVNKKKAR